MSTTPSSDENDGSSTEPPSSSQANNDDGDGLWGLTTALGSATSWGLGTLAAAATVATEPEEVQEEEDGRTRAGLRRRDFVVAAPTMQRERRLVPLGRGPSEPQARRALAPPTSAVRA